MNTRLIIPLLAVLLCQTACTNKTEDTDSWKEAVAMLDQALSKREEIALLEESRLAGMRADYATAADLHEKFVACDSLFREYYNYNLDSAFAYAHRKEDIAREIGDQNLINGAKNSMASRYLTSGMYREALDEVEQIDTVTAFQLGFKSVYYQTLHSIYHGLALTTKDMASKDGFRALEHKYQALSRDAMTPDRIGYYTVNAGIMIENGQSGEARQMLQDYMSGINPSPREYSVLNYWIAKTYSAEGDIDKALAHFATSAFSDMITPVKSSRSLVNTARLLMQKKQTDKAYAYITRAYHDASESDANICLNEIADILPDITEAHQAKERSRLSWLWASVVFLVSLVTAAFLVLLISRKYHRQIRTMNASLEDNVVKLKEANDIKDICLGRYLSMFSNQISSLERYRSALRITSKSRDMNDILQALKSDDFIDNERKLLYEEFDETFLAAFPNFVSKLNSLLREDARIGEHLKPGRLNNELRIFALIRLGVTESSKIASFLKKSPSTVYNYRVKLRNACVCGYDNFEKKLMEIGIPAV